MSEIFYTDYKPTKWFGYSHNVQNRIMQTGHSVDDELKNWLTAWWRYAQKQAEILGYKPDNKTVIQLEDEKGNLLFIGNFDGNISVGFGVREW